MVILSLGRHRVPHPPCSLKGFPFLLFSTSLRVQRFTFMPTPLTPVPRSCPSPLHSSLACPADSLTRHTTRPPPGEHLGSGLSFPCAVPAARSPLRLQSSNGSLPHAQEETLGPA